MARWGRRSPASQLREVSHQSSRQTQVSGSQSKSGQWSSTGHFSLSTACGLASCGLELYFKPVIERIGRRTVAAVKIVGRFGHFMGDLARAVPDVDVWGRLTLVQLRRVGVDSLPVALFIAAFTGVVLALQASYTFRNTVPLYFVGTLVGKTMMLELGPVLAGLALAGRVGASMAAELGTMRVTEQVDALETLAYDPQSFLVLPRVLAGTAMFPIIVALAILTGILTGWIASLAL